MDTPSTSISIGLLASTLTRLQKRTSRIADRFEWKHCASIPQLISEVIENRDLDVLVLPRKAGSLDGITILEMAAQHNPAIKAVFFTDTENAAWLRAAVSNPLVCGLIGKNSKQDDIYKILASAKKYGHESPHSVSSVHLKTKLGFAAQDWITATSDSLAAEMRQTRRITIWLCEALNFMWRWECEQAAILMHLGRTALPPSLAGFNRVESIRDSDSKSDWLRHIRYTLAFIQRDAALTEIAPVIAGAIDAKEPETPLGRDFENEAVMMASAIVRSANTYQAMLRNTPTPSVAWQELRGELANECPRCVEALQEMPASTRSDYVVRHVLVSDLKPGMYTEDPIEFESGGMILGSGQKIDRESLARLHRFAEQQPVQEPIQVSVPSKMVNDLAA